jgi:urate oxidase/2-oxo-4-hydroxy-4-carboxy-5-ureidoimidazoline decarboxylase
VHTFQSGFQGSYYGKGDVTVYRLHRDGPVFAARVLMLIYGDAFWPTYTTGDNTGLIATDSMKNFIQRETLNFEGFDLESFCRFLARRFLDKYPQAEGAQLSAEEIPYRDAGGAIAFAPAGPEHAIARVELRRSPGALALVEAVSGLHGFKLLRLGGSAFHGFVRDEYTTLPDIRNRPLHMWLDVDWLYTDVEAASAAWSTRSLRRSNRAAFSR